MKDNQVPLSHCPFLHPEQAPPCAEEPELQHAQESVMDLLETHHDSAVHTSFKIIN
jgi:hypothetical protein